MERIRIARLAIIFVFLFLTLSLLNLQVVRGKNFRELSYKNSIRLLSQEGNRGRILDRNNNLIAGNELCYDLMVMPQDIKMLDKILTKVAVILGASQEGLKNKFKNSSLAAFLPVKIAENIEIKQAIALEELKLDLGGIIIQPRPRRIYPYGRLASHVLGYLNEIDHWRLSKLADYGYKTKDIVGFGGVEEKYDYYLRQEEGGLSMEVDHRARFIRVLGFRPPKNGKDIRLTLDLKIQKIAEENLGDKVGCIIIMDPDNGEIIAMASQPDFNPAVFIKRSDYSLRNIFHDPDAPLINRAITGVYPAGSIFKLIVAAAALETKKINLSTTFLCQGSTLIGKQEFACWNTHGQQNLLAGITHSCNIFFYKTGLLLGGQTIHDWAVKFGFAKATSIDLPYEEAGFLPHPVWKKIYRFKHWFEGDTANLSIGQAELQVSPLQIARMMAVFANRGNLVTPYVVAAVDDKDIAIYQKKSVPLPIKKDTLDYIRQGLRKVIADPQGTASILSALPVSVAGKTGTAQAPPGRPHGWFVGFFPFKNPKFVICVFLERGTAGYYASILAKQVIEEMFKEGLL